jgi:hypothetical protein
MPLRSEDLSDFATRMIEAIDKDDTAAKIRIRKEPAARNEEKRAAGRSDMVITLETLQRSIKARTREAEITPKVLQKQAERRAAWGGG